MFKALYLIFSFYYFCNSIKLSKNNEQKILIACLCISIGTTTGKCSAERREFRKHAIHTPYRTHQLSC